MSYNELLKDYERIREYMRQFYIYGFKKRDEYDQKSARSYDNERRRIESWLGKYLFFRQDENGKQVFLSVDSRQIQHNPLYRAFAAKSFTDKDITLHFYLLDLFADGEAYTTAQVVELIDKNYLSYFDDRISLDVSTVRKKLKEYEQLGLFTSEKRGKETWYQIAKDNVDILSWRDALAFYSEKAPLGVVGFLLLEQKDVQTQSFRFKHHYILHALDSQVLCDLLTAMQEHCQVEIIMAHPQAAEAKSITVYPLKIYSSSQTGRQYLLSYQYNIRRFVFHRVDKIIKIKPGPMDARYEEYTRWYENFKKHLWGVSTGKGRELEHIELTIHAEQREDYIPQRLLREKRCGQVKQLDETTWRFIADVYDATELLPWLRTFIGRIVSLECSNPKVVQQFYADLNEMAAMYGGENHAVP